MHVLSLPTLSSPTCHFYSKFPNPQRKRKPFSQLRSLNGDRDAFTEKSGYLFSLSAEEANSLVVYDVKKIEAIFYNKKPLVLLRRLLQVGFAFGRWFVARYLDDLNDKSDYMFKIRAAELRKILLELGPAYIKIAQAVSSRADLIPPSYLDELSLLQDRVAPFSTEVALSTIEQELGSSIDDIFSEISPEPIAAASLGQVYQARLRCNGKVVAVKVQRPGVQAAISLDILILRFMAQVVKRVGIVDVELQGIVDEWASSLFQEMDYMKEAKNGLKFRKLYGTIQDVVVPEMYLENTTRRVIVMEWVEGKKLSEVKDLYLVEVGVYCAFNQLLEYGFYHADPHPGNLLRTDDGKLAYIDFGMMGEFKDELRDGFIETCLHLVNRDFDALVKAFVTLGLVPQTADKEAVAKALTGVFQNAVAKGVLNMSFGELLENLGTIMYKYKFPIPSDFSLVVRSLAVLEGIAISSYPNYKVLGSTYPWIARKVLTDSSPKMKTSLQSLLYTEGVFRIDRLESLLSESLRAITGNALILRQRGDADLKGIVKQILSFTLTEKGSFIRDILLEELAKGLDALGLATLDSLTSFVTTSIPFATPVPSISMTEEDIMNLRALRRLLSLLSLLQRRDAIADVKEVVSYKTQNRSTEEVSLFFYQLPSFAEIMPILHVIPELPLELQQKLIRLPTELAGRLVSRATARTLRRLFL